MPPASAKRARLQVIKRPLDYVPIIHTPNFPKMPILYMELLENKKKVIPELRNKEYIPDEVSSTISPLLEEAEKSAVSENFRLDEEKSQESRDKSGSKSGKETKGRKKGTVGIIDLSRMSAAEISQMAANRDATKDAKSQSKTTALKEHYSDAFPVSGKTLDENYHKTRLAGKSEALSQISGSSSGIEGKKRDINSTRENEDRKYFIEEENTTRKNDRNDRNDRNDKYNRNYEDRYEDKYDNRYEDRHEDRHENRHENRQDERQNRSSFNSDRDHQESHRSENSNSRAFESYNNDSSFVEDSSDRLSDSLAQKEKGLAGLITTSASGLRLEDVLSGQASLSQKSASKPFSANMSSSTSSSSSSSSSFGTVGTMGAGLAAGMAVGMSGGRISNQQRPTVAPSLTQIQQGNVVTDKNGVRDVKYATAEEVNEETKKQNLLFKFKILKRTYKEATIPEFSEHTPLNTLQREYDSIVRQLALDATVENYKKYLTIGFFVLEFVVANMFHLEEIKGFATQQMVGMNQYEKTLYLLGEQSALSGNKPWPPIVQLILAIMINGAIYVGSKMFFRSTGTNIMNMIGGLGGGGGSGGQNNSQSSQMPSQSGPQGFTMSNGRNSSGNTKPRMRGPDISLEDITGKKSV